jgi:hypothetical protein
MHPTRQNLPHLEAGKAYPVTTAIFGYPVKPLSLMNFLLLACRLLSGYRQGPHEVEPAVNGG